MRISVLSLTVLALLAGGCSSTPSVSEPGAVAGRELVAVTGDEDMAAGQLVYVPIYSHAYFDSDRRTFKLVSTLSVRNTDMEQPITLRSIRYHDSSGKLVRDYLKQPVRLEPLASVDYIADERDQLGTGTAFLVEWVAETEVHEPVIEAVMISTALSQGLSFTSQGRVLRTLADESPKPLH